MSFPFKAVLFDMDGTLTDNKYFHDKAWQDFCRAHLDLDLLPDDERVHGGTTTEVIANLLGRKLAEEEALQLHDAKEIIYREMARGQLKVLDGLHDYLERLQTNGVPVAVVSNAVGENLPFTLRELGLEKTFAVIVDGAMTEHAKPAPDMYELACRLLDVDAWDCVVHEDSFVGIKAALAAGCKVSAIMTSLTEEQALAAGAHWANRNFEEWMRRVVWTSW